MMSVRSLGFSLALCFGLALSACAHAPQPPGDAEIERQAAELVARRYPADGPGAAILIARGDMVLYRGARGESDIEAHTPLSPDDVFRLGSVTKQFAAAGLLSLVEDGRVSLDDPLSRYLPDFPRGGDITVRQILNHTSGVHNYTDIDGYMIEPIRADLTTAQMIDVFENLPLDFEPGTRWSYSNSGYVLVGAVIEAASGMPWHEYLRREFFEPLGMRHTGYGGDPRLVAQQAHGYSLDGGAVVPMRTLSMTQPHAAGALVSTVDDLLIWNRALHEGRVLSNPLYTQMITPTGAAGTPPYNYGFGIAAGSVRDQPQLEHGGGIFGFSTSLSYVPGADITVVVLENSDSDPPGAASSGLIARRLAAIALNNPYPEMIPIAVDTSALQAAEAVYLFDGGIKRTLRVVDGRLTAQREGRPRIPLTPIARDDFLYDDGLNRIQLIRDASGAVTSVRYFGEGEGEGVIGVRSAEALAPLPVAMALPRATLERVVGIYAAGELNMNVFLDGETLRAQLTGQSPVTLRATAPTVFAVEEADAIVEFAAEGTTAAQATIKQGGEEITLTRTR